MAALSAAIEIIQPLTGRSESITDFLNGATGILIAMVLLAARESPRRTLYLCLLVPLAAACTAVAFLPAWKESAGMRWRSANFPMLGDFENEDELRLWIGSGDGTTVERVREHASHGEWSLRVTTNAGTVWPGVRLLNAKQDWRGRTALAFDIWNDGPAFTLAIRVDDDFRHQAREDRYNSDLAIGPGWNHIAIPVAEIGSRPKNRRLNLAAIQTTVFYVNEPKTTHAFYIDHMRLE